MHDRPLSEIGCCCVSRLGLENTSGLGWRNRQGFVLKQVLYLGCFSDLTGRDCGSGTPFYFSLAAFVSLGLAYITFLRQQFWELSLGLQIVNYLAY